MLSIFLVCMGYCQFFDRAFFEEIIYTNSF